MLELLRPWRRFRLQQRAAAAPIPAAVWTRAIADLPILDGLDGGELDTLRRLATWFLRDKLFETAGGMMLDDPARARIAVLACLPILGLDYHWYDGWRTVIVYPGAFVRPRAQADDSGVMHEWDDILSGESWERGPVILSWADVAASGQGDGYNVAVHEMAHKLDMLNGGPDGFPPLHRDMDRRHWTAAFSAAFADLDARVERGETTAIDPYAAESPAEFFAVLSEYFFERPELVHSEYPAVYAALAGFYRQDPRRRQTGLAMG